MPTFYERAGSETAANNLTPGFQTSPRITYLANGKYVVTWVTNAGASPDDIQARIFNADGTPFTGEFTVNAITAAHQTQVDIAALTGGGFVVTWSDPGANYEIRARIFDANGGIVTPADIAINDPTLTHNIIGDQLESAVIGLSGGRFAVTWTDFGGSDGAGVAGPDSGIRTRVFNADGTAASGETLVNTQTVNAQQHPAIAMLGTGYVVTWQDGSGAAGQGVDIRAQRFDLNGARIGGEILVTSNASTQEWPATVELANGNFVIAWVDFSATGGDSSSTAIKARIISPAGVPIGSELLLNSTTNGAQVDVALARLADGGFVATFTDIGTNAGDTSFDAVRARTFDANGAPTSAEFLVNTSTVSGQYESAVASDANGNFAIAFRNDASGNPDISFQRFAVDASPTLTGLASSVTFAESAVNGVPQLLDADVVLTDDSGNFAGETFTVSGGLAEDTVAIRNQGSATGQIGLSGGDVSYGGVAIGTVTGGTGATPLSVVLNANATTAAVDALIQNLTYANDSNTPTATRTLSLNITDGGGFAGAGTFSQLTGTANPFNGIDVGLFSDPELIDLDGDGDLDLVVGAQSNLQVYRNDGAGLPFTQLTGSANPFNGITTGDDVSPSFVDLDGDGDLDAVIGNFQGQLIAARNNGAGAAFTVISGAANPFNGIDFGTNAASAFIDFDDDGDLDTVTSSTSTALRAFRNDGSGVAVTELTGAANPFAGLTVGSNGKIGALDFDFDGDRDLVLAAGNAGPLEAYRNNGAGQPFTALTGAANPFNGISASGNGTIGFGDFDRDGDTDFVLGMTDGTLAAFRNDTATGRTIVVNVTAVNDAPTVTNAIPDQHSDEDAAVSYQVPANSFTDPDGDTLSYTATSGNGDPLPDWLEFDADSRTFSGTPSQNYNGTFSVKVTATDGIDSASDTFDLIIDPVDDAPVAQPDAVSTPEDTVGTTGNLLANDTDVDGPAVTISGVTGGTLGVPFALPSGAILQVNSDGTYSYNPNGKFNTLTNPSGGEVGAVNTSATDSFQYTVSGGNTVTVTVTITGVANQFDWLAGDGTDNTISGTPNGDFFYAVLGGTDDLSGLGGNDVFYFDGGMTSADKVDGGAGIDQIALQGNYAGGNALTFGADVLGIENLVLLPGNDTRFGDTAGNLYDYNITLLDVNVASGVKMVIDANRLRPGEDFTFNGSAETDGTFFIYGGGGTDHLTGGAKNDVFLFGAQGQWGSSDVLVGGGGIDQLALRGDYTIVFGAGQLVGIEQIAMVSAFDTRFGALGDTYDYNLTMNDGNVVGIQMTIDAAPLRSNETLTFDGSAEDDGSFRVFGGAGQDVIKGSQNADIIVGRENADMLTGNGGNDVFRYNSTADSTPSAKDKILDFAAGDLVDVSRIDADTTLAGDQAFSFIGNAAFGNVAGELRYQSHGGTEWLIQGDTNGDGTADFELILNVPVAHPITSADFIL